MTRASRDRVRTVLRRTSVSKVAVLLVALSVWPARADNTADEAGIAFGLGNKHYARRDYETALSQYFLSYRLVPNRNVLFNIAHCYEALRQFDEAYRYYYDLSSDPTLADADRKDIRMSLTRLAPRVALLSVTSQPPGAELYIDREDLGSHGKTPQTIAVSPGAHTLMLRLNGYHPAQVKVTLVKGKEVKQALTLERIVGRVELTGTPVGAVVRETSDGPQLGRLPTTLALVPGAKLLVVQAEGYAPSQMLVDVKPGATITASVQLSERTKPTGKVIVTANRDNALVRVDGQESGFTPTVLSLTAGAHHLEITAEEAAPWVRELDVTVDSETRLNAELRYAPPPVKAASKTALSVDQAPASVTIITREEIQSFGYQTLPEALRAVRGFFFTDEHIYTYIGVRGFSPPGDLNTRILVLYDGHTTNDGWAGQGYSARDFDIDLNEVDRIEVVRGPASILYGTGALFGVINVVPREHLAHGRHVEGAVGTGHVGGVKARVTGSAGSGDTSVLLSASGFNSTGGELTQIAGRDDVKGLDGERALGTSVRAKWHGFTLTGKLNQRRKQVPTAPRGSQLGVSGTEYTDVRGFAELRYDREFGRVSLSGRLNYDASRFRGYYASNPSGTSITRQTDSGGGDWAGLELRAAIRLWSRNRLTVSGEASGQFLYEQFVGRAQPERPNRFLLSATVLDEWQLTGWLFVQGGVRLDQYLDLPEPALSPRGALVIKPYAAGVTKVVVGQSFRAPNIYELTFNDDNKSQRTPAPGSLKPELITTFEIEHSHNFTPEFRVTLGGYYNLIDRLVTLVPEALPMPVCGTSDKRVQCKFYANSLNRLTAIGAEAQLRWQPGRFTLVDATYSFVVLSGGDPDNAPVYPTHLASVRAMVPLREGLLRLSSQVTYQSARPDALGASTGEALLVNFGFAGDFGPVRYFAGVQNLLDQRFGLPVFSESGNLVVSQYGRTFWLELAAGF